MSGKQQKNLRASEPNGRSEAPANGHPRAEPLAAKPAPASPAGTMTLRSRLAKLGRTAVYVTRTHGGVGGAAS